MLVVPRALAEGLHVDADLAACHEDRGPLGLALAVRVRMRGDAAVCPDCHQPATRVHSTYERSLADLPLQGAPVRLTVRVRRFRCDHAACARRTFVEPLAALAAPRARRTARLLVLQTQLGMALGGAASARLLPGLGAPASGSTVLRLVHHAPLAPRPTPRVLGVDDWAIKRGHRYGTLLVDLEARRPVDLLPDREAETLADWLRTHPGVEVISRDRAEAYAEGARVGAPTARQVADRWHLLKNVGDVLERVLHRHRSALREAAAAALAFTQPAATAPTDPTPETSPAAARRAAARAHRQALYDQIHALRARGVSIHAIGAQLGLSRATVRVYVRAPACPTRAPRRTMLGSLSTFDTHLRARWSAGCHDATVLWSELRGHGFRGSLRSVQRHVQAWPLAADAPCPKRRVRKRGTAAGMPTPTAKPPSPRLAMWWLVLPPRHLSLAQCASSTTSSRVAQRSGRRSSSRATFAISSARATRPRCRRGWSRPHGASSPSSATSLRACNAIRSPSRRRSRAAGVTARPRVR